MPFQQVVATTVKESCLAIYDEKLGPLIFTPSRLLWLEARDTDMNLIFSKPTTYINYDI